MTEAGSRTPVDWRALPVDDPTLADHAASWRSAYVHIPFCRRRCPYCDFAVVTPEERPAGSTVGSYVDALLAEIQMEPPWQPLDAVNFGGGTPSTLDPVDVARVLDALHVRCGLAPDAEVSVEANPEDITAAYAAKLAAKKVNRISLGVQSFDPAVLAALGRAHNPEQSARAVAACREGGIASISIDLIFGTAGESVASWSETVAQALELEPDHLSAYALTVERGTALSRAVAAGAASPDSDVQADMYEALVDLVRASPLVHYEISNFARMGHACRYNLATWAQGEYAAFGLGAHGHRDGRRRRNLRRLDRYLEAVAAGQRPEAGADAVSGGAAEKERLMLGLRRRAGVVAGVGGSALVASEAGRRLEAAGVLQHARGRVVIRRPLLTDEVNRVILDLPDRAMDGDASR